MSDDILNKIKNNQPITSDEIKKETQGLKPVTEGFTIKNFSVETSTKQSTKDDEK